MGLMADRCAVFSQFSNLIPCHIARRAALDRARGDKKRKWEAA